MRAASRSTVSRVICGFSIATLPKAKLTRCARSSAGVARRALRMSSATSAWLDRVRDGMRTRTIGSSGDVSNNDAVSPSRARTLPDHRSPRSGPAPTARRLSSSASTSSGHVASSYPDSSASHSRIKASAFRFRSQISSAGVSMLAERAYRAVLDAQSTTADPKTVVARPPQRGRARNHAGGLCILGHCPETHALPHPPAPLAASRSRGNPATPARSVRFRFQS